GGAGAGGGERCARLLGLPEVLAYDMGGTTAKACLIRDAVLPLTDEVEVARSRRFTKSSGFPVAVPAVSMIEIGAGGGSIARVSALGLVQVGPDSAGAEPGPACYGLGGSAPTVSDADLVLGYLDAERFAGGTMRLDRAAAERAIESAIARPTGTGTTAAAWTIHDVVNEPMAAAGRDHVSGRRGGGYSCERARRRSVPSGAGGVRWRRSGARLQSRRQARYQAHPCPAARRRALGARPGAGARGL